jgi:membrane protein DedA with SNARE-associated domain
MRKRLFFSALLSAFVFLLPQLTLAQAPVMDSTMVKNGKIYVVVAVLVVIFIGIVLFLLRLEQQLRKLEQKDNGS